MPGLNVPNRAESVRMECECQQREYWPAQKQQQDQQQLQRDNWRRQQYDDGNTSS